MSDKPLLDLGRAPIVKGRELSISLSTAERLRAARGVRQAIVKVRSFGRGKKGVMKSMSYISRKGELELETESGVVLGSVEEQRDLVKDWSVDFDERKDSRDSAHIIFSMPPRSDPEALRRAIRTVGAKAFGDHEWVFAIHQDKGHPHAHMILKMRGRTQEKKLDFKKADLHRLREVFAEAAREQGVELAASPRASRGVGKKGVGQFYYYLKRKGIRSEIEKKTADDLLKEIQRGDWKQKPWEKSMAERNKLERDAYQKDAATLRQAAENSAQQQERDRLLKDAVSLERFAQSMPKPKTRRQESKERIWQLVKEQRRIKSRSTDRDLEIEI